MAGIFNGSTQYLTRANADVCPSAAFTFGLSMKIDTLAYGDFVAGWGDGSSSSPIRYVAVRDDLAGGTNNRGIAWTVRDTGAIISLAEGGLTDWNPAGGETTDIGDGFWTDIVVTMTPGDKATIYTNGRLWTEDNGTPNRSILTGITSTYTADYDRFSIGALVRNTIGNHFAGQVADAICWERILGLDEIYDWLNMQNRVTATSIDDLPDGVSSTNLLFWYPLNTTTGLDSIHGSAKSLTNVGTVTFNDDGPWARIGASGVLAPTYRHPVIDTSAPSDNDTGEIQVTPTRHVGLGIVVDGSSRPTNLDLIIGGMSFGREDVGGLANLEATANHLAFAQCVSPRGYESYKILDQANDGAYLGTQAMEGDPVSGIIEDYWSGVHSSPHVAVINDGQGDMWVRPAILSDYEVHLSINGTPMTRQAPIIPRKATHPGKQERYHQAPCVVALPDNAGVVIIQGTHGEFTDGIWWVALSAAELRAAYNAGGFTEDTLPTVNTCAAGQRSSYIRGTALSDGSVVFTTRTSATTGECIRVVLSDPLNATTNSFLYMGLLGYPLSVSVDADGTEYYGFADRNNSTSPSVSAHYFKKTSGGDWQDILGNDLAGLGTGDGSSSANYIVNRSGGVGATEGRRTPASGTPGTLVIPYQDSANDMIYPTGAPLIVGNYVYIGYVWADDADFTDLGDEFGPMEFRLGKMRLDNGSFTNVPLPTDLPTTTISHRMGTDFRDLNGRLEMIVSQPISAQPVFRDGDTPMNYYSGWGGCKFIAYVARDQEDSANPDWVKVDEWGGESLFHLGNLVPVDGAAGWRSYQAGLPSINQVRQAALPMLLPPPGSVVPSLAATSSGMVGSGTSPILHVTEMASMGRLSGDYINAEQPAQAYQEVTIGGASVASASFGSSTKLIRVEPGMACHINIGASPTASSSTQRLEAGKSYLIRVNPGDKIAVIQD